MEAAAEYYLVSRTRQGHFCQGKSIIKDLENCYHLEKFVIGLVLQNGLKFKTPRTCKFKSHYFLIRMNRLRNNLRTGL